MRGALPDPLPAHMLSDLTFLPGEDPARRARATSAGGYAHSVRAFPWNAFSSGWELTSRETVFTGTAKGFTRAKKKGYHETPWINERPQHKPGIPSSPGS
jgi:hypothetical protein